MGGCPIEIRGFCATCRSAGPDHLGGQSLVFGANGAAVQTLFFPELVALGFPRRRFVVAGW